MEDHPTLERASFEFSQNANCLSDNNAAESIEIELVSSLGIDRDENNEFFVIETDGWSLDSAADLEKLFNRIKSVIEWKSK